MTEITATTLKALAIGQQINCDTLRGFRARKLPSGLIKLGLRYSHAGRQHEINLGLLGEVTLKAAQVRAMELKAQAVANIDPLAKLKSEQARATNTLNCILDRWLDDARKRGVKTADTCARDFARLIRPAFGARIIYDIKRTEVERLLKAIEEDNGHAMAVKVHGELRAVCKWWKKKDDDFNNDPVPGGWTAGAARQRVLTDQEVRDVWLGCEELGGVFGRITQVLLLTGCRRMEIGALQANELMADDLHGAFIEIAAERMKKGKPHVVPITAAIAALLPQAKNGFLFTAAAFGLQGPQATGLFDGYGYAKAALDRIIARRRAAAGRGEMPAWTLHDLRRTVRTGCALLGVAEHVGEAILAHTQGGISEIYHVGKFKFFAEKRAALELWAAHVERLVHGLALANVVPLPAAAGGRVGGIGS